MPPLIACPSCEHHVKSHEPACPLCGARLRDRQGRALQTAGAVLMGLTLSACGDKDPGETSTVGSDTASATSSSSSGSEVSTESYGAVDPAYGSPATGYTSYGSSTTEGTTQGPGTEGSTSDTATTEGSTSDTTTDGSTSDATTEGSTSDATLGTTTLEPDYGVPTTSN